MQLSNVLDNQAAVPLLADLQPLPPDERTLREPQHQLVGRAPAGAVYFRLGIRLGKSKTHRWFPGQHTRARPAYRLDPFEFPCVPTIGSYTVVYLDEALRILDGPRYNLHIGRADFGVNYCQGDRSWRVGRG